MATIGNMPFADVTCMFDNGTTKNVNAVVLSAHALQAGLKARGLPVVRNMPTLAWLRDEYCIERYLTPTWARMAEYLGYLREEVSAQADANKAAYYAAN